MKGKQIKVEYLLAAILVLIGTGAGGMLLRPSGEPDHTLPARIGDVIWNHELHARMKDVKCTDCHHKSAMDAAEKAGATTPKPCKDCHHLKSSADSVVLADVRLKEMMKKEEGVGPAASDSMTAYHSKCMGCHVVKNQGPVGCRDCHMQRFTGRMGKVEWDHREHSRYMELDCEYCHHKDKGTEEKPVLESEYRACDSCHQPAEVMSLSMRTGIEDHEELAHKRCFTCHTEYNPELGAERCVDCHTGMAVKEGAPSVEEALHERCLDCHHADHPDAGKGMPITCGECHRSNPSMLPGGTAGTVVWSHERHAAPSERDCNVCHHKHGGVENEPYLACRACHGRDDLQFEDVPSLADAMHWNQGGEATGCIGCHEKEKDGPTECEGCHAPDRSFGQFMHQTSKGEANWSHRFHAQDMAFSCRECHHNTWKKDGKRVLKCGGLDCPEGTDVPLKCGECHVSEKETNPVEEWRTGIPSLGDVVHDSCIVCHERLAGPTDCDDCHVKR